MSNILTKADRSTAYEIAEPVKKFLYSHPTSGRKLKNIAQNFNLQNYKDFAITIGDLIFGFYKTVDLIPLLQQELELDQATAERLGADVLEFLAPLSNPAWQPPIEADNDSKNADFSNQITNEVSPVTLSTPEVVAQIEEPRHHEPIAIPEIRTMAADMAIERSPARNTFNAAAEIDELVHVSNQPTLEKKIVDVPSYSSSQYPLPKPDASTTDSRWN